MLIEASDLEKVKATKPVFSETGSAVAGLFYERLFELGPELRGMFPQDLSEQNRKLSATLALTISSLENWDELAPILASLARRHIVYGVKPWHYAVVTQSLLDTLRGAGIDDGTVAAWNRVMSTIGAHMIAAAYGEEHGDRDALRARTA